MTDLTDFARLVTLDNGLCVVSTLRGDGTIQSSVVNAGVLDHPLTGRPEGPAELAGPGDPLPGVGAEALRLLLRAVFTAAGGTHDDWETYDRVMAAEGRTAVLVEPRRVYAAS